MATSKIVRVPCAFVLTIAFFFSTQLTSYASDDSVASESTVEVTTEAASDAPESCCAEGYQCSPIEPVVEKMTEDTEDAPACHGILTCTFFVGGHIIALPFRVLNWVFRIAV